MSFAEPRKIIKIGEKSLAVTLPKKWIKQLGLKPGDTVSLIMDKTGIIKIFVDNRSSAEYSSTHIVLDASGLSPETIITYIRAAYTSAIDRLIIRNVDKDKLINSLSEVSRILPGSFILESEPNTLTVKIALSEETIDIDELITRIMQTIILVIESYKTGKQMSGLLNNLYEETLYLANSGLRILEKKIRSQQMRPLAMIQAFESMLILQYLALISSNLVEFIREYDRSGENDHYMEILEILHRMLVRIYRGLLRKPDLRLVEKIKNDLIELDKMVKKYEDSGAGLCRLLVISSMLENLLDVIVHRHISVQLI